MKKTNPVSKKAQQCAVHLQRKDNQSANRSTRQKLKVPVFGCQIHPLDPSRDIALGSFEY